LKPFGSSNKHHHIWSLETYNTHNHHKILRKFYGQDVNTCWNARLNTTKNLLEHRYKEKEDSSRKSEKPLEKPSPATSNSSESSTQKKWIWKSLEMCEITGIKKHKLKQNIVMKPNENISSKETYSNAFRSIRLWTFVLTLALFSGSILIKITEGFQIPLLASHTLSTLFFICIFIPFIASSGKRQEIIILSIVIIGTYLLAFFITCRYWL